MIKRRTWGQYPPAPPLNFAKASFNIYIMHYVYILRSLKQEGAIYIGYTSDLKSRLKSHSAERNLYSKRYAPWEIETYLAFTNEQDAKDFERYLKGGSGKAFLQKHLISQRFKEALKKFNNGRSDKSSKPKA